MVVVVKLCQPCQERKKADVTVEVKGSFRFFPFCFGGVSKTLLPGLESRRLHSGRVMSNFTKCHGKFNYALLRVPIRFSNLFKRVLHYIKLSTVFCFYVCVMCIHGNFKIEKMQLTPLTDALYRSKTAL